MLTSRREQFRAWWPTGAVVVFALYWSVAMFPTPARLLSDHGHGFELAGASEILAGHHPFIHFTDIVYGPAMHYASMAGQWLAGGRVSGELALVCASFALGYALLFRLMLAMRIPMAIALAASFVAIVVKPEAYRYQLLLLPILFLATAWCWLETRSRWWLFAMALTIAIAGLFRSDLGVFTFLAAVAAIATAGAERRQTAANIAGLTGLVLLAAAPWLAWLAAHGKLLAYLENSSIAALQDVAGRARPVPPLDLSAGFFTAQNVRAYLFRLPLITLLFALVMLVVRRRQLHGNQRAWLYAATGFAVLTLLQGSHIVDWFHVRDTLPIRVLLLAWIAAPAAAGIWAGVPRAVAAFLAVTMVGAVAAREELSGLSPAAVARKVSAYHASRDEMLAAVQASGQNFRAELYAYVRDHSEPDEGSFAVLEAPQMNYFANRRFAAEQMAIFPGYFSGAEDQRRLIEQLRTGRTAFVVIDHLGQPEYPDMTLEKFAPEFYLFLRREFVQVASIGYCRVLTPRWRKGAPLDAPNWWEPSNQALRRDDAR